MWARLRLLCFCCIIRRLYCCTENLVQDQSQHWKSRKLALQHIGCWLTSKWALFLVSLHPQRSLTRTQSSSSLTPKILGCTRRLVAWERNKPHPCSTLKLMGRQGMNQHRVSLPSTCARQKKCSDVSNLAMSSYANLIRRIVDNIFSTIICHWLNLQLTSTAYFLTKLARFV